MSETKPTRTDPDTDLIEADLYEDLLNRYERVLVYAGELREKLRVQEIDLEKVVQFQEEAKRVQKGVALDQAYIRLLEGALEGLGILSRADPPSDQPASPDSNESRRSLV